MQNVLITGGYQGIGYELAQKFKEKYNVIVIDKQELAFADTVKFEGINYFVGDLLDKKRIKELINLIVKKFGNIQILLNNAAHQTIGKFLEIDDLDIETNLLGTLNITRECLPFINKNGHIFNILSIHSRVPRKEHIAYDCSKAALFSFTKNLALELADVPIYVNAIEFGATSTPLNDFFRDKKIKEEAKKKIPLSKIAMPEEIANFVFVILENLANNTTGSIFTIDGGRSLI